MGRVAPAICFELPVHESVDGQLLGPFTVAGVRFA